MDRISIILQDKTTIEELVKDPKAIAQEALQDIEKASADYADGKLPFSSYCEDWEDIAHAFRDGAKWMANKLNIS